MCLFFSIVSDGRRGKIMYFDAELRQRCKDGDLRDKSYNPDSHTSIADFFGYKGAKEDCLNKYEYNPLTQEFTVDQMPGKDDSGAVEKLCMAIDFKTVLPQLIIKPIVHPFTDRKALSVSKKDLRLLKKWASIWNSVRNSVWDSVGNSVWDSVEASVWASVRNSVWDLVGNSVWASVWDSVEASVWDSVEASVWDSVWAYTSTFFDIKYKYDFSSAGKLWERGIIPSFDGETWRLHGYQGKILKEMTMEELKSIK